MGYKTTLQYNDLTDELNSKLEDLGLKFVIDDHKEEPKTEPTTEENDQN